MGGFIDIFVLALIAGFIALKLFQVLGRKEDDASSNILQKYLREPHSLEDVTPAPSSSKEVEVVSSPLDSKIIGALTAIHFKDNLFSEKYFLDGAKRAFDVVLQSFAKGDRNTLRDLLNDETYAQFSSEIDRREQAEETMEHTLVAITKSEIIDAALEGNLAHVTVRFITEQINVIRNKVGDIIGGHPSHIDRITDIWTFARPMDNANPNWKLVATHQHA